MIQNTATPDDEEPVTDYDTVRDHIISTIKGNTGSKQRKAVKEALLFQILSSNNVDLDVASKVLADHVSDEEVLLELDEDDTHCYRLAEADE